MNNDKNYQGKWDGLGGILKGYLVNINNRFLTWELNMNSEPTKNPIKCDGGRILTAEHAAQQLKHNFASEAWRAGARRQERPVSRIEVYYTDTDEIAPLRPENPAKYDRIVGISKSYQYMVLKTGAVLARRHSCWCPSCLQVAISGPAATSSSYKIDGCGRAAADAELYEYTNQSCAIANGAGTGELDDIARNRGHQLAPHLQKEGGEFILVEASGEDEDGDVMWLAEAVPADRFQGNCSLLMKKRMTIHGSESRSTNYTANDHAIAVEWYERVADDPERRTFVRGDGVVCFINSTELRRIVGVVDDCECDGRCECDGIVESSGDTVELSRLAEFRALEWCRC